MASAEILSDLITNAEASPRVMNNVCNEMGKLRVVKATLETTTGYDTGDIAAFFRVPANASIVSLKVFNDDSGNAGTLDIGLYTGSVSTALTVADVDVYAAALDIKTAASTTGVEIAFASRDIALVNQLVYTDAGDTAGEFSEYWLCATCVESVQNAGTLTIIATLACA